MGLTDGLRETEQPNTRPSHRCTALILALLLVGVSLVPAAAAFHNAGVTTEPWVEHCEAEDWVGIDAGSPPVTYRACFTADAEPPEYHNNLTDRLDDEPQVHEDRCGQGFDGLAANQSDTWLGLCVSVDQTAPSDPTNPRIDAGIDLEECQAPDGQQGEDPAVFVADGGVAVCAFTIFASGVEAPNSSVSPEPCDEEPEAVDPEVRFGGGRAEFCADILILGSYGSPQINLAIQLALDAAETAIATGEALVQEVNQTAWCFVEHFTDDCPFP